MKPVQNNISKTSENIPASSPIPPHTTAKIFVDLTGNSSTAQRKVTFQLPSAHTPKPLSAARRHVKPPDPVPLASVQPSINHPRHQPISSSAVSPERIIGWADDVDVGGIAASAKTGHASKSHEHMEIVTEAVQVFDSTKNVHDFDKVPGNPAVWIKRESNPTSSRPQSALRPRSTLIASAHPIPTRTSSVINLSLCTTPQPKTLPHPIARMQTVRSNIDRYRIEQIALRRLRFVIENNEAEPDHLAMIDLVEQSGDLPPALLQRYFGPQYVNVHSVRLLLLQSIDRSRRLRQRPPTPPTETATPHRLLPRSASPSPIPLDDTAPIGRQPVRIFSPRRETKTPEALLRVLEQAEKGPRSRPLAGSAKKKAKMRTRTDEPLSITGVSMTNNGNEIQDRLSGSQILKMIERKRMRHLQL